MDLVTLITSVPGLFPKPPIHTEIEKRASEERIVAKFATGNIYLMSGRYLTEDDIEKKRKAVLSYMY